MQAKVTVAFPWLALAAAALAASAAGAGVRWHYEAKLAQLRLAHANERAAVQDDALARITAAVQASDLAVLEAQIRANHSTQRYEALRRELDTRTTSAACLRADARRVLEAHPAFGPGPVPGAAAGAAAEAAAPSAGTGDGGRPSSDRDLAQWALKAAELYEQCRGRVDALRGWSEAVHGG